MALSAGLSEDYRTLGDDMGYVLLVEMGYLQSKPARPRPRPSPPPPAPRPPPNNVIESESVPTPG